ncbi:MAG: Mrp/NBP35 family ATP-binding protein [Phycisphaerales bacterium]|nr:MAG: Mrp/NBP35 family ATP-binding protein [Phycisphaerales bacterium]
MPSITREDVVNQLRTVNDPELHQDLVTLNMVKEVQVDGGLVRVGIELTTPACPLRGQIGADVEEAIKRIPGVEQVEIEWGAQVRPSRPQTGEMGSVKNVIAIGSGKGGVGKSTVAVLLATGLRRAGATVGLLDSDVYGPSIPTMIGIEGARPEIRGNKILPIEACGLRIMSIGLMVERDTALIWRGPMVHGVVKQFLEQVAWGNLDYLIVDLPPGTGDVPLTLAQSIPMTGSVTVCTPQDVAVNDARRAVRMYEQLSIPCLGIIENMSYYLCPKCGHRDELFDHGGALAAAQELGVPYLGEIPLNARLRKFGDEGTPEKAFTDADDYVVQAIGRVVSALAGQISIRGELKRTAPTLTIE